MEAKKASYPIALMARVEFDQVDACAFDDYRTQGAPRLVAVLAKMGAVADKKTIAASLKRQGLEAPSTRSFYHHTLASGECDYDDHCQRQWDKGALDQV